MTPTLAIKLLGSLELELDGQPVTGLASRKAEALLAFLACNPRPHARDTLATLLWDDRPQRRALANLSVLLSSLRKQLDPFFTATRHEIAFNKDGDFWLDTAVFTAQITATRQQIQQRGRATRNAAMQLAQAMELYQGDFLQGFYIRDAGGFEEWTLLERERLQRLAVEALDLLVDFYLERSKFITGIDYATRLVALDPLREHAHRQLMRLLAAGGQRNAALEQYDTCCRILEEELGVPPAEETTELFHTIRRGGLDLSLVPLTVHHNLPAQTTSFVGREQELAAINGRLADPACRLLTLVGPGGSGKTRLLLEAARRQIGQFLDGIWFVPLASLPGSDYLAKAIAQAIGFDFVGNKPSRIQLLTFLQQKELLLVLDSFEHLLDDDGGSDLLAAILAQAPDVKLLVSSRQRLHLQAEWLQEIGGLPYPANGPNGRLHEYGAVKLFTQRAHQVAAGFELTTDDVPAVKQICRLVAGMPLGLELAAANVRHYRCADIATALSQNLDFLSTAQRDVPPRHRSLRAAFDYSWQLLSAEEQAAFRALAVFRDTFSTDAALAVLKTDLAVLHALVDKSLLQRGENGRFHLHDTLHQYAAEKLAHTPDLADTARRRHGAFYARFLQQRQQDLQGGRQLAALEEIQTEIENVRAAWQYAQTLPSDTPALIPLLADAVDTLFHFYSMRSWFREGTALLAQAIDWLSGNITRDGDILLARLRARYGWLAYLRGDVEKGTTSLQHSLSVLETASAAEDVVFCLNYLGAIAYYQNDFATAQQHLQRSLILAQETGNRHGEAIAHNILGVVLTAKDELEEAERSLQSSLTLKRQLEDRWGIAFSLESLGRIDAVHDRREQARSRYEESLAIRQEIGDRRGTAFCLQRLGDLAQRDGDTSAARDLYGECLSILTEIGATRSKAAVQQALDQLNSEFNDGRFLRS